MKRILFSMLAMLIVLGLSRPAMAVLIDRGSFAYDDGAGHTGFVNLIYDVDFDITWVGDGDFANTTGFDSDGKMQWGTSFAWAGGLTIGGFTDWRLPTALNQDDTGPVFGSGAAVVGGSEMGHLFYGELGGTVDSNISESVDPDLGLFPNMRNTGYWSSTEFDPNPGHYWLFFFNSGWQDARDEFSFFSALAVMEGDVAAVEAVPEPATIALLGIGLAGMIAYGIRRRRQRRSFPA